MPILAFAIIAEKCYDDRINDDFDDNGWEFQRMTRFDEGKFSVWKVIRRPAIIEEGITLALPSDQIHPVEQGDNETYVIAVRGSHEAADWVWLNPLLAFSAEMFFVKMRDSFKRLTQKLKEFLPLGNGIQVIFNGHSLGATTAEIFCHMSRLPDLDADLDPGPDPLWRRVECIGAITFDSPGINPELHGRLQINGRGVLIVNSSINIVNTLFKPCCECLYACGRGSHVSLDTIIEYFHGTLKCLFAVFLANNAIEHAMTTIISYIGRAIWGDDAMVKLSDPGIWPTYSGYVVYVLKLPCVLFLLDGDNPNPVGDNPNPVVDNPNPVGVRKLIAGVGLAGLAGFAGFALFISAPVSAPVALTVAGAQFAMGSAGTIVVSIGSTGAIAASIGSTGAIVGSISGTVGAAFGWGAATVVGATVALFSASPPRTKGKLDLASISDLNCNNILRSI